MSALRSAGPARFPGRRWAWIPALVWLFLFLINAMHPSPDLGPTAGRLLPCPSSPNCVCSQDDSSGHAIAPLLCPGPATATQELSRLRQLLAQRPRTRLWDERPGYLRYVVTTAWLRFRDDLEFLADDAHQLIHVRSASRLGHGDLGTNRRRVEEIRALFNTSPAPR